MDCVRGWIGNWGVIWDWDGHTGLLGDYHTSDCKGWTLLLIDCNRWEPSGNRLTISSNISDPSIILWQCTFEILIFNILRFFSTNIPYSPQPRPSLVPSAKSIFVQAFFTLLLWSNTDLFSSFNWLHSHIFLRSIERRLFINSKKGILGNRKMHLSNKQRSITTAFLPTIRYCCLNDPK